MTGTPPVRAKVLVLATSPNLGPHCVRGTPLGDEHTRGSATTSTWRRASTRAVSCCPLHPRHPAQCPTQRPARERVVR